MIGRSCPLWEKTAAFALDRIRQEGTVPERDVTGSADFMIAAVEDGHIAGVCTCTGKAGPSGGLSHGPCISFVSADGGYREKGLAERMIDRACLYAREKGNRAVYMQGGDKDLCEKTGFVPFRENGAGRGDTEGLLRRELYKSLLLSTSNTRDLGGLEAAGGKATVKNRIWRSDVPRIRNAEDIAALKRRGITSVIDLRTTGEKERTPCALSASEGFDYFSCPIRVGTTPPSSLEEVPDCYLQIALQKETADALRYAARAAGGIMIHCTAGKDRTGVLCAIILTACGVGDGLIVSDYAVSREFNREQLERYLAGHPGTDRRIVTANERSMEGFLRLFRARFGSAEGYFAEAGLSGECLALIREKLLGGA